MKKYKWIIVDFFVLSIIILLSVTIVVLGKWEWKWGTIFFVVSYFFNSIFVIFSVANNDNQTEKLSWIFFMICVPYIGLIFYMLFRVRRDVGITLEEWHNSFEEFKINKYEKQEYDHSIANWQSKLIKRNLYNSNLKVFQNGHDAYEILLEDIKKAKKYIFIEMYIIKESEIYEKVKEILINKVNEGVDVRLIIDKFGSWKVRANEIKFLKHSGIKVAFFNIPYYPYVRHTDNKRLHRKFFIIDGKVVHFGGLNISDEYCSFSKKYGYWADSNFSATGKIINDYQSVFLFDWYNITKEKIEINNLNKKNLDDNNWNCKIMTFEEGPTKKSTLLEDSIDFWINSSKKSIKIATPYFVPTEKIFNSIKNALIRGVDVEIYIPGLPDKKLTYNGTLFYSNELIGLGAKVYKLNETFLHSKFGIFDEEFAYIGTNNLDMRSFYTNQESINIVFGDEIINSLNDIFNNYKIISHKLKFKNKKIKKHIDQFIFKLLAPLM